MKPLLSDASGPTVRKESSADIGSFTQGYRAAWEGRDEAQFGALFASDGEYHNTPFATQRGHAQLAAYWQRVKLQEDGRCPRCRLWWHSPPQPQ